MSRDLVGELWRLRQEPEWLLKLRLRALEAYERLPMPDQRTEGWRRTSLRGMPSLDSCGPLQAFAHVSVKGAPSGRVVPLEEAVRDTELGPKIQRSFGQIVPVDADKLVALHYALFNTGVVVLIPRGTILDEPIWVEYDGTGPMLAHTLVILEDEANVAALVEDYKGASGFASGVVEQVLGGNAHLRYVHLQRFAPDVWNFSTQRAHLSQDASL